MAKERITITGVDEEVKRRLAMAAATEDTTVSEIIRARLPDIIAQVEGIQPTYGEVLDVTFGLVAVVVAYQLRRYKEAEASLEAIVREHRWITKDAEELPGSQRTEGGEHESVGAGS